MIWLKRCPRCKGDLKDNRDIYGCFYVCIQCGYYLTDSEEAGLRYPTGYRSPGSSINSAEKIEAEIAAAR